MKKFAITLGLALFGLFTANAQNENAAQIEFESTVIDYGTIPHKSDGNRVFKFTNTGKEPLIITSAQGSCGCTVPTWPREPIAPGESGEIKVHYDTKRQGGFTKTVTVNSNAATPKVVLRIKGTVEPKTPVTPANTQSPEETTPVKKHGSGSPMAK